MQMIDMARDVEQEIAQMPQQSIYPYGLSICLTNDELEKLGLESNCEVGDMIHLMAMAKVTSISKNETQDGESCRIELQITHLGLEDEDKEEEVKPRRINPGKFYGSSY